MKCSPTICACAALLLGTTVYAGAVSSQSSPYQGNSRATTLPATIPPPSCAPGFNYSVKEQWSVGTGQHLWYICKTPTIRCPDEISANVASTNTNFRFSYSCTTPKPGVMTPKLRADQHCATGFTKQSPWAINKSQFDCATPTLTCPPNPPASQYMIMSHKSTTSADKHGVEFEYECYRPV